ncbi:hypothetical protein RRG08_018508 [Elysia crispata]|uniref:Uncharacterized protein n=1 Tax=Elysia crispata TaxID=231223 RepID=A0AAE1ADR6_9GAST|nr:hypothetical protein RRG08_018508 [Elysia crispata]
MSFLGVLSSYESEKQQMFMQKAQNQQQPSVKQILQERETHCQQQPRVEQMLRKSDPSPKLKDESSSAPTQNHSRLQTGSWVVASFPFKTVSAGKKYLGIVLAVDSREANIKFYCQSGSRFTWPLIDDIGWMPICFDNN